MKFSVQSFNQFSFIGLDDALDALAKEQKQQEIVATKYQSKSINVTENGEGVTSVTVSLPSSKRTSRCGSVNRDQQVSILIDFDKFMGSKFPILKFYFRQVKVFFLGLIDSNGNVSILSFGQGVEC